MGLLAKLYRGETGLGLFFYYLLFHFYHQYISVSFGEEDQLIEEGWRRDGVLQGQSQAVKPIVRLCLDSSQKMDRIRPYLLAI